ncbi:MAG: hypothetical protein WC318_04415 [Candidatus Omnitrophota bacterium]|jgi:hypothetical protein
MKTKLLTPLLISTLLLINIAAFKQKFNFGAFLFGSAIGGSLIFFLEGLAISFVLLAITKTPGIKLKVNLGLVIAVIISILLFNKG